MKKKYEDRVIKCVTATLGVQIPGAVANTVRRLQNECNLYWNENETAIIWEKGNKSGFIGLGNIVGGEYEDE